MKKIKIMKLRSIIKNRLKKLIKIDSRNLGTVRLLTEDLVYSSVNLKAICPVQGNLQIKDSVSSTARVKTLQKRLRS